MYSRQDYEELQAIRYRFHAIEEAAYTVDRKYRILRETIGTKETYQPQAYQPEKQGWTQSSPDRKEWGTLRHAGYYPLRDEQRADTIEEALALCHECF